MLPKHETINQIYQIVIFFLIVQDLDVIFKHKSLILETISDIHLLEQGVEAMDDGTQQVAEVQNQKYVKETVSNFCRLLDLQDLNVRITPKRDLHIFVHVRFCRAVGELTVSWSLQSKLSTEFWVAIHSTPVLCASCCMPTSNTFPIPTSNTQVTESSTHISVCGFSWLFSTIS